MGLGRRETQPKMKSPDEREPSGEIFFALDVSTSSAKSESIESLSFFFQGFFGLKNFAAMEANPVSARCVWWSGRTLNPSVSADTSPAQTSVVCGGGFEFSHL